MAPVGLLMEFLMGEGDWADRVAHYLVGDVPWRLCGEWTTELPVKVAQHLREAAMRPRERGTGRKWRDARALELVLPLKGFVDPVGIRELEVEINGALAVANAMSPVGHSAASAFPPATSRPKSSEPKIEGTRG